MKYVFYKLIKFLGPNFKMLRGILYPIGLLATLTAASIQIVSNIQRALKLLICIYAFSYNGVTAECL